MPRKSTAKSKTSVHVDIDEELAGRASSAGIDLAAALEEKLRDTLAADDAGTWRLQNRAAIEASNRELEANGLWCDDLRPW